MENLKKPIKKTSYLARRESYSSSTIRERLDFKGMKDKENSSS